MTLIELVKERIAELGMTNEEFARKLCIKQPSKVRNFLYKLKENDMRDIAHVRRQIAAVLMIPLETVDDAIEVSQKVRAKKLDDEWRKGFRPHAVLITEREIPRPIFVAAVTGSDRELLIDLPENISAVRWPKWVLERLPSGLPGFGMVTGFVLNHSPDHALQFDLDGNPIETLDKAYRRGQACLRGVPPLNGT